MISQIKKLFVLFTSIFIFSACAIEEPLPVFEDPLPEIEDQIDEVEVTIDINQYVFTLIQEGENFEKVSNFEIKNLPSFVYERQTNYKEIYSLGDLVFLYVHQGNMNYDAHPRSGEELQWIGVLFSNDNGESWEKFYTLNDPPEPNLEGYTRGYNLVGLSVMNGVLALDIADDHGAGSGEGMMIRFISDDGGLT